MRIAPRMRGVEEAKAVETGCFTPVTNGEAWQTKTLEDEDDDEIIEALPARRSPMQRYRTPGLGSGGLESELFDGFLGLVIQLIVS